MTVVFVMAGIAGVALLVVSIKAMMAQINTYNLLKELAEYGGFQNYQRAIAKKDAQSIIAAGYVNDTEISTNLQKILLCFKDYKEAQELAQKLSEINSV